MKFLNGIVLCGNIPDAVQSSFFGATLIALSKKDGGVRPISVGNTLRCLAGKACMFKVSCNLTDEFQPHQMDVCIPSGAEVAVHACRNFIRSEDSNSILLKIDFQNAFNTVKRDAILHKVKESLLQIFPFVFQAYAQPTDLFFGKESLLSKEGVQQGDPLGPLLFLLAIQDLISDCDSKFNMWYLGDGTLRENADTVFSDFQKIIQAENSLGLSINPSKCKPICLHSNKENTMLEKFKIIAAEIKLIRKEDLPVLLSAVDAALLGKLTFLIRMLEKLDHLDAHESFFLLKNCLAIPKLTYILRTSVCYHSAVLAQYDLEISNALEKILNISLTTSCWEQSSLPVKLAGLGICSAQDVALPAFLSSLYACMTSMPVCFNQSDRSAAYQDDSMTSAFALWSNKSGLSLPPQLPQKQKSWDTSLSIIKLDNLVKNSSSDLDKARLLAVSAPHASHWLNALPLPSLGLKLDNSSLRIACTLCLSSFLCHPHECICRTQVDSNGVHGLSCKRSAGRFSRHSHVNNLIKRGLESARIPTILEPQGVSQTDGKRPDRMTIFCGVSRNV